MQYAIYGKNKKTFNLSRGIFASGEINPADISPCDFQCHRNCNDCVASIAYQIIFLYNANNCFLKKQLYNDT